MLIKDLPISWDWLDVEDADFLRKFSEKVITDYSYFEEEQKRVYSLWKLRMGIKVSNQGKYPLGIEKLAEKLFNRIRDNNAEIIRVYTVEFIDDDIALFTTDKNYYIGLIY